MPGRDWQAYLREVDERRRANMQQSRGGGGGGRGIQGLSSFYKNIPIRKGPEGKWQTASDIVSQAKNDFLGGKSPTVDPTAAPDTPFNTNIGLESPNVNLSSLDVPAQYQVLPGQDFMNLDTGSMMPSEPFGASTPLSAPKVDIPFSQFSPTPAPTPTTTIPATSPFSSTPLSPSISGPQLANAPIASGQLASTPVLPAASAAGQGTEIYGNVLNAQPGQVMPTMQNVAAKEALAPFTGGTGPATQFIDPLGSVAQASPTTGGSMPISAPPISGSPLAGANVAAENALPGLTAAVDTPGLPSGMVSGSADLLASGEATPETLMSALQSGVQGATKALQPAGQAMMSGLSQLGTMLGGLFMSDETKKEDKKKKDEEMKPFLDALQAYGFKYKDQAHGKGQKFGIMAQDLEKSKVGKALVRNTPIGKQVDIGQGVGTSLAALSYLHKRLKKLEGAANGRS